MLIPNIACIAITDIILMTLQTMFAEPTGYYLLDKQKLSSCKPLQA